MIRTVAKIVFFIAFAFAAVYAIKSDGPPLDLNCPGADKYC